MEPKVELEWLIHYKCNFRCPYCFFEGMWGEVEKRNVYRPLEEWVSAWMRILKKYGCLRVLITGGEPFIYPGFVDLLKEMSPHFSIGFDTNLSCSEELLADFAKNAEAKNVSLGLSFHPQFAQFDSFLKKALFLQNSGFKVCVQYVSYPKQLGRLVYYKDRFRQHGLYFIPLPFRGVYNGLNYPVSFNEEQRRLIYGATDNLAQEHKDKVDKLLNQVKTKEKLCRAGQVYARIDVDGTAYRCGHYVSGSFKTLGNLFDEDFKLWDEPAVCQQEVCPCEFRWLVQDEPVAGKALG
jgi:MoaA/NifB/PqqE/SkfB family radical SAM enzyme